MRFKPRQADLADSECVEVREQKFAVAEIEPRRLDHARDQFGLMLEVVPVVR